MMTPSALLASYSFAPPRFDLAAFCGVWYIIQTNLALWQNYSEPTITYTPLSAANTLRLLDVVAYTKSNGQPGRITGIDRVDAQHQRLFHWRGNRWYTCWLTSTWCVVDHDPYCAEWAVTYFSPTPFTKAGIDLYARAPALQQATLTMIHARLRQHPFLHQQVTTLFATQQRKAVNR